MTLNEKTMSMKQEAVPLGFKQTEVGIIPEDWMIINIAKTMKLINGYGFKPSQWEKEGLPIIRIQNLNDANTPYNYFTGVIDPKFHVKNGDLLFAWSGSKGVSFGARVWQGNKAILNQHIFKIIPDEKFVTTYYSYYVLRKVQEQIEKMAHGFKSSFVHVKKGDLENTPLPIPPKKEQKAIANVLSDTDALIIEFEKLITKKQAIKTAAIQQLLTGRTRLPKFAKQPDGTLKSYKSSELGLVPVDWEVKSFNEITKLSSSRINPKVRGGGDLCIELEHIQPNSGFLLGETITTSDSSLKNTFEPGDILFGKLRAYLKKYWFANINGVCSTEFWVLKPDIKSAISKFIYYIVQTDNFIAAATESYGSHMPRADWKVVKDYQIMLPGIEEQTAIATILSDMDAELEALEQKLAKVHDIRQGMMQQLLTGRIRLPLDNQP